MPRSASPTTVATYSIPANAAILSLYALLIPPQLYLSIRHKTYGFLTGTLLGLILELTAYVARIQLAHGQRKFLQYLVTITIAPAFFSAAIYLCLARIVVVYGSHLSPLKPRTYTVGFMVGDLVALVLQATGAAIAAGNDDAAKMDLGIHVGQAGLAWHLANIVVFVGLGGRFAWTVWRNRGEWDVKFVELQRAKRFMWFLISLAVATLCIFVRTAYRVIELSEGFQSALSKNETLFMVLEAAMVLIAVTCLTIFHPGVAFQGRWADANFQLKTSKPDTEGTEAARKPQGAGQQANIPLSSM
ncbi:RTA1-domain-containing protein [Lentithecium fluviatile CBS 122367]|uniref:RTA1-domain-containing protein n=1 Tax=Lentithecium fluviatile CBS 122367 TaxID=1168545 RepID=A0A6G1IZT2_9PLEO|nr:RTA1-domain-containing protein [Lentithecium fluviatile CBS 122367]